ncbi:MAG TPA: hypothetical protein VGX91_10410 [Candidatus Cybelea sp.]|nr:hypothetical protein [Candidatus Cybelea sp.]
MTLPPAALVAALMRDPELAACARDSGRTPAAYVAGAVMRRDLTLHDGARMTVAVATDPCMARGQSTRIAIYRHVGAGYARVLDALTIAQYAVNADGTATLPTHESMETIFESTYVWNGTAYVFSRERSHIYDLPLGERRPLEVPLPRKAGARETTLSGTFARSFGQEYAFSARAGEQVTIEPLRNPAPAIALWYDDASEPLAENVARRWTGTLAKTGTYRLIVLGGDGTPEGSACATRFA